MPQFECVHDMIARQADRLPDREAVVAGPRRLTYRQLDQMTNQLAHQLKAQGVRRGSLVAVYADRSAELILALLATLRAGAAFVPIDVGAPAARRDHLLRDTAAKAVLTQSAYTDRFPNGPALVMALDADDWFEYMPVTDPVAGAEPDDLVYVMYTSGSTGTPKGVMLEHAGVSNRLSWMRDAYDFGVHDRILQKTPYTFDVSVWELFLPLICGGTLVMAHPGGHRDPAYLAGAIRDEDITTVHFVPSMLRAFLVGDHGELPTLRHVFCSGEALSMDLQDQFFDRFHVPLHNLYGPTEASIDVTAWTCRSDSGKDHVPIGRPIDGVHVHVLDEALAPVPVGEVGELMLGGVALARGYLNQPDLTAGAFIRNPLPDSVCDRLYRTGDLVRAHPDGNLEYLGRIDQQVKLRGQRIELGEIETRLRLHHAVADAMVELENEPSPRLVAYLRVHDGDPGVANLRRALTEFLPESMVPAVYRVVDDFPLTSSGKLNRAAVCRQKFRQLRGEYGEAPRDEVQAALAGIWARILREERVGVADDFFELGGDSIMGIQVVALAKAVGMHITVDDLFTHRTIERVAAVSGTRTRVEAEQGPVTGEAPTTPIQRWFLEHDHPCPAHWNMSLILESAESVDEGTLRAAMGDLLGHHDALRTRFTRADGGWRQRIGTTEEEPDFEVFDHRESGADLKRATQAVIARRQAVLDLERGPVAAATLVREPDRDLVILVLHHLVTDGVSWRILTEDLETAYRARLTGTVAALPKKTDSYLAWARRWEELAGGDPFAADRRYWHRERPSDGPPRVRPPGVAADSRLLSVSLSPDNTRVLLREAPRLLDARPDEFLVAALAAVLMASGEPTIVDLEGHGREHLVDDLDITRTVGWFTSIYPVDLRTPSGDLLDHVRRTLRRIPHKGLGYDLLRYQERDPLAGWPARTLKFNYLGRLDSPPGALFTFVSQDSILDSAWGNVRTHPLDVTAFVFGEQLRIVWEYETALHSRKRVARMAESFLNTLAEFTEEAIARRDAAEGLPLEANGPAFSQADLSTLRSLLIRNGEH